MTRGGRISKAPSIMLLLKRMYFYKLFRLNIKLFQSLRILTANSVLQILFNGNGLTTELSEHTSDHNLQFTVILAPSISRSCNYVWKLFFFKFRPVYSKFHLFNPFCLSLFGSCAISNLGYTFWKTLCILEGIFSYTYEFNNPYTQSSPNILIKKRLSALSNVNGSRILARDFLVRYHKQHVDTFPSLTSTHIGQK